MNLLAIVLTVAMATPTPAPGHMMSSGGHMMSSHGRMTKGKMKPHGSMSGHMGSDHMMKPSPTATP